MRRFTITNLLFLAVVPMMACAVLGTDNYYLFSTYDKEEFSNRVEDICSNNWKTYLGLSGDQWFYFNAEEVAKTAREKNDALMASYALQLGRYLQCVDEVSREAWSYPTKEQIAQRNQTLRSIRAYASSKLKTRLRSQHALLYMRCNMMLKAHNDNIKFWEQTASQYIETVYKDMMQNIYAGALYHTGQAGRAAEIFAEQGDYNSLMTQYYKKRSYAAIRQEYQNNPNSKVLPFLLQDFVNNAQEAIDATAGEGEIPGKLFIRDISRQEAQQMMTLCRQVVSEQKTETPVMWQSALAWLEYLFGNRHQALLDIRKATTMKGTQRMEETARVLRIYIAADQKEAGTEFDNWAGKELQWLYNKSTEGHEGYRADYHYRAYTRIINQNMTKRYLRDGRQEVALALLKTGEYSDYHSYIDTTTVENLLKYRKYLATPGKTEIDRFVKGVVNKISIDEQEWDDLLGTKHLRLCQWQQALEYLQRVPASYYTKKGYAPYAALRKVSVEPWVKRQWLKENDVYGDRQWTFQESPKVTFAKEMLSLETGMKMLSGQDRQQRCYDLAVRYAQANFRGDCWFLMRDGKSIVDTLRCNETDLAARARQLLQEASSTTDAALKERVLFALCYSELYDEKQRWYITEWNSKTYQDDIIPQRGTPQWKAFARLADYEKGRTASRYVSRCDEYDTFSNRNK